MLEGLDGPVGEAGHLLSDKLNPDLEEREAASLVTNGVDLGILIATGLAVVAERR